MPEKDSTQKSIRVGIIDDHPTLLEGLASILEKIDGIQIVMKASNGKELIDYLKTTDEPPDILLMDVIMPEVDGIAATEYALANHPSIKVIAFSGNDDDWSMTQMAIAGACAYIRKDAYTDKIRETIEEVHRTGRYHADLYHLYGEGLEDFKEQIQDLRFTENEKTLMQLLCKGLNLNKISIAMDRKIETINYYKKCISEKLKVKNQALMVIMILRMNEVKLNEPKNWDPGTKTNIN